MVSGKLHVHISHHLVIRLVVFFLLAMPGFEALQSIEPDWCKKLPRPEYRSLERVSIFDEWFEVYRVHSGTYAIYEPRQYEEVISFLITGTDQALLLDSGMGIGDLRKVVEELTGLPVTVLNTHTHPDHIGSNHQFQNILGMDTPFTNRNADGYRKEELKDWVHADHICGALPQAFDPSSYQVLGFSITRRVRDGEILDLGNRRLEILFTPGHTPDSLCLLDRENRLLFTGDTFYPGPIYLIARETDFEAYTKSVRRIATLTKEVKTVLPSHNLPMFPAGVLDDLDRAVQMVREGKVNPRKNNGLNEYLFNGFSLLIKETDH